MMSRNMKWKRAAPGAYTSGDFKVTGSGTDWMLSRLSNGDVIAEGLRSKKEAQLTAEGEPARAPKLRTESSESSVSEISMLRHEVSSLALAIAKMDVNLTNAIKELVDVLTDDPDE